MNFHNSETNSYITLFTSGLTADKLNEKLTEKQFEDRIVTAFRKVNENVIQVNVFPASSTPNKDRVGPVSGNYVARVYLKTEQAGRDFIVDYDQRRGELIEFYKTANSIRFNINTDDKTLKKIKQFERKAGQIMSGIKNETDRNKLQNRPFQQPINPGFGPMMQNLPQFGGLMSMQPNKMPGMAPMPNQQGFSMPPMIPQMGMGGMMPQGMNRLPMGPPMNNPIPDMRNKIEKLYNERNHYIETCKNDASFESNFKRQIFHQVKFVLENDLKITAIESGPIGDQILQRN